MTDRLKRCLSFLKSEEGYIPECGIFDSRNTVGDMMENIYDKDGIQVDVCRHWDYIEVFGLSSEEFKSLCEELRRILKLRKIIECLKELAEDENN